MKINRSVLDIAINEAEELFKQAVSVDKEINDLNNIGKILTANILLGLTIEIYLKAFMIAGRNDVIVKGHNLKKLYDEFPSFLKFAIEEKYNSFVKPDLTANQIAIIISENKPEKPEDKPNFEIDNLDSVLTSISDTFVKSRYFFEEINESEWAVINYYFDYGKIIAESLKMVLDEFIKGDLKKIKA